MSIAPGTRLGAYEVLSPIGAGGMGEVYKARDTRLDRAVAIKVLPASLAEDPQFRERFDREARTISRLSHPNICALFDTGDEHGTSFLVLEYLEGQTLADRLAKGALDLSEALRIGIEIAEALGAAQRVGVVHRDIKPGNVMLTRSGSKLLDFGLAKTAKPAAAVSGLSMMPTTPSAPMTAQGTILGTFQYMAPEQIEGEEADARTDIFGFGCVLYEMLTGRKAFVGKTQASLISAILKDQPPPIADVQPVAPAALDRVVTTCLAKNPDDRWQHAGDIVRELKWIASDATAPAKEERRRAGARERALVAVASLLLVSTLGLGWMALRGPRVDSAPRSMRLALEAARPVSRIDAVSNADPHPSIVLSPDGKRLVYVADVDGTSQLFVRDLDGRTASAIPGTEGAVEPFFSPDGQWIGFSADRKLKKAALRGGAPATLADAPFLRGAHWYANDSIAFVPDLYSGVKRLSASGGKPEDITTIDGENGEKAHRWPDVLPGSKALLFAVGTGGSWDNARIVVQSLETGERRTIVEPGSNPRYVPPGFVVYARARKLTAVPFDPATLRVTGPPTEVSDDVMFEGSGAAQFTFAAGVYVALPGVPEEGLAALVWVDRRGAIVRAPGQPGGFGTVALAPDGHRVLLGKARLADLQLRDLSRGIEAVVTSAARVNQFAWLPDGSHVVFASEKGGAFNLVRKRADGTGDEETLLPAGPTRFSMDVSRDGKWIVYEEQTATGESALWVMSLGDRVTHPLPRVNGSQRNPAIAPNGRLVASQVATGSQIQVFIQPFPEGGQRLQASTNGGTEPRWSPDGRELFYRNGNHMMAVSVSSKEGGLDIGAPRGLFDGRFVSIGNVSYSVGPDGRFLMLQPLSEPKPLVTLDVITNWFDELKRVTAAQR